ncbi:InlB B-repeat-containing protein, partial [Ruminococcaceae bacterium OttesenSCG-928-A16]|nr:InlB B-repeat-containing protein [Ruminococcaceae bacterium OttesenSCG-928-A16]
VATNITVYAQWVKDPAAWVTVTFMPGHGLPEIEPVETIKDTPLGTDMPDDPTQDYYLFTGWNTELDGSGTSFDATTTVATDITVYAQWVKDPEAWVTVTFMPGDGLPEIGPVETIKDTPLGTNMPANPVQDYYLFTGWAIVSGGTAGEEFTSQTPVSQNMVVKAQWQHTPSDVLVLTFGDKATTYNGTAQTLPAATATGAGDITILYGLAENGPFNLEAPPSYTNAGSYPVWAQVALPDYVPKTAKATLTINPAAAHITVNSTSKVVNTADPTFTGSVTGLVKATDLGEITFHRQQQQTGPEYAGATVTLTASYTQNPNYTVTLTNGTLTILPIPINPRGFPIPSQVSSASSGKEAQGSTEAPAEQTQQPPASSSAASSSAASRSAASSSTSAASSQSASASSSLPNTPAPAPTNAPNQPFSPATQTPTASWSILNLLFTIVSTFFSLVFIAHLFISRKKAQENTKTEYRASRLVLQVFAIIIGVIAILAFIRTQNLAALMVITDKWTLLFALLPIVQLLLSVFIRERANTNNNLHNNPEG